MPAVPDRLIPPPPYSPILAMATIRPGGAPRPTCATCQPTSAPAPCPPGVRPRRRSNPIPGSTRPRSDMPNPVVFGPRRPAPRRQPVPCLPCPPPSPTSRSAPLRPAIRSRQACPTPRHACPTSQAPAPPPTQAHGDVPGLSDFPTLLVPVQHRADFPCPPRPSPRPTGHAVTCHTPPGPSDKPSPARHTPTSHRLASPALPRAVPARAIAD